MHRLTRNVLPHVLLQVYIAQLHRRAVILDRRFKDKVMEAFNLSASESYSDNEYGVGKPSPRPSPTVTASTESHWKMSTGTRSGSETDKNPKLNCDPSDHGHPSCDQTSQTSTASLTFVREGKVTHAEIVFANVKKQGRMREKLARYEPPYPGSQWPLTAHITDPVRLSVVCSGPSDVMQVSSGLSLPLSSVPLSLASFPCPLHRKPRTVCLRCCPPFGVALAHSFCCRGQLLFFAWVSAHTATH